MSSWSWARHGRDPEAAAFAAPTAVMAGSAAYPLPEPRRYECDCEILIMTPVHRTLSREKWQSMGLKEQLANFAGERTFEIPPESLEDYFMAFALRISSDPLWSAV